MMTSGEAVEYKSSLDVIAQILKNEGAKSAGANILRAIAGTGAGVLAGYEASVNCFWQEVWLWRCLRTLSGQFGSNRW